jgi:hypothetical protein
MADTPQPNQVITPGGPAAPIQPTAPDPEIPDHEQHKYQLPQHRPDDSSLESIDGEVSWTASEFVSHEKSAGWYGGLALAAVLIGALIYLLTGDLISSSVVLIAALFLGIMASRKPRQLAYTLNDRGLSIGSKQYVLEQFRSFSIIDEGAIPSIVFMPLKRFSPMVTIYYAPEDEEKIATILADRLPFEEHRQDPVDRLMRRIRF